MLATKMRSLQKNIFISLIVTLIGLSVGIIFLGYKYNQVQNELKSIKEPAITQKTTEEEVKMLTDEVGKLIDLPKEEPTVATVKDLSKLSNQPFFQKAKTGDRVLIYTNAKKAILYDPQQKRIIDIASINISTESAQQVSSPSPQASSFSLVLRNGTSLNGLSAKLASTIQQRYPQITIVSKDNAAKSNYAKTVVVSFKESSQEQANLLAQYFHTTISPLPTGETKPDNIDILVILGRDASVF